MSLDTVRAPIDSTVRLGAENEPMTQGPDMPADNLRDSNWRALGTAEYGLAAAISDRISEAGSSIEECVRSLQTSPVVMLFSDYGGAHKDARFEVISFLAATPSGASTFCAGRQRLRQGQLGNERRMSYKSLGDKMRLKCQ